MPPFTPLFVLQQGTWGLSRDGYEVNRTGDFLPAFSSGDEVQLLHPFYFLISVEGTTEGVALDKNRLPDRLDAFLDLIRGVRGRILRSVILFKEGEAAKIGAADHHAERLLPDGLGNPAKYLGRGNDFNTLLTLH